MSSTDAALSKRPRRAARRRPDNPYPGLRAFEDHEARIFFGRNRHIDEVLERLATSHFVPVLGPSGCGKSSLIRAGVIPALRAGRFYDAGTRWRVAIMRPEGSPIWNLAEALYRTTVEDDAPSDPMVIQKISSMLITDPDGLANFQSEFGYEEDENVLLLIDQFEELFNIEKIGIVKTFIDAILNIYQEKFSRIHCIITMRTDHLGECTRFTGLAEAINNTLYLTPTLTEEELREVVELPAIRFQSGLEDGLLDKILVDMEGEFDQLPLMQHIMRRMWDAIKERPEDSREFTLEMYEDFGCVGNTINHHAAQLVGELDKRKRKLVQMLFRQLTERREGATYQDVRRPALFKDIAAVSNLPSDKITEDLRSVVNRFRAPDALFLRPLESEHREIDDDTRIDIVHECLIRKWDDLRNWVEQEWKSAHDLRDLVRVTARNLDSDENDQASDQDGAITGPARKKKLLVTAKNLVATIWWIIPDLFSKTKHTLNKAEIAKFDTWFYQEKPNPVWARRYGIGDATFEEAESHLRFSESFRQRADLRIWGLSGILLITLMTVGWIWLRGLEERADQQRIAVERIASGLSISASLISQQITADVYGAWKRFTGDSLHLNPEEAKLTNVDLWVKSQKWLQQRIIDLDVITNEARKIESDAFKDIPKQEYALLASSLTRDGAAFATLWGDGIKLHNVDKPSDLKQWAFPTDSLIEQNRVRGLPPRVRQTSFQLAFEDSAKFIHAITDTRNVWRVDLEANALEQMTPLDPGTSAVTFSRNGRNLAVARKTETEWLFENLDLSTGDVTTLFKTELTTGDEITSMSFEAESQNILAVLFDGRKVTLWDTKNSGIAFAKPEKKFTSIIGLEDIQVSEVGDWVAGSQAFAEHIWDIDKAVASENDPHYAPPDAPKGIRPHGSSYGSQPVVRSRFVSGEELLLVRNDGKTALWNYRNGVWNLKNGVGSLRQVVNSAQQPLSVAINASGHLNVIDAPGYALNWNFRKNISGLKHVLNFSPEASGNKGPEDAAITSATIADSGSLIAIGDEKGNLKLYEPDLKDGAKIQLISRDVYGDGADKQAVGSGSITMIGASSDGTQIVTLRQSGQAAAFSQNANDKGYSGRGGLEKVKGARAVSMAPNGLDLAVLVADELVLYSQSRGEGKPLWSQSATLKISSTPCSVAYSQNGKHIAIGTHNGDVFSVSSAGGSSSPELKLVKKIAGSAITRVRFSQNPSAVLALAQESSDSQQDCPDVRKGQPSHLEILPIDNPGSGQIAAFQSFKTDELDYRGIAFLPRSNTFVLTDKKMRGTPSFQFIDTEPAIRVAGTALGSGQRGREIPTERYFNVLGLQRAFTTQMQSKSANMFATEIGCSSDYCWMIAPTLSNRHLLVLGFGAPLDSP